MTLLHNNTQWTPYNKRIVYQHCHYFVHGFVGPTGAFADGYMGYNDTFQFFGYHLDCLIVYVFVNEDYIIKSDGIYVLS